MKKQKLRFGQRPLKPLPDGKCTCAHKPVQHRRHAALGERRTFHCTVRDCQCVVQAGKL